MKEELSPVIQTERKFHKDFIKTSLFEKSFMSNPGFVKEELFSNLLLD